MDTWKEYFMPVWADIPCPFMTPNVFCAFLGETLATYDQLYTAWEAGLQKCRCVLLYSSIVVFIYDSFCFFASWLFMFELKNVSSFLKE